MTKPNTPAESIMEGLQDALGYVKALADYFEDSTSLDGTYNIAEDSDYELAKDAFDAGWNAAVASVYDKQDIQTIKDRANEPRTKVDVGDL